MKQLSKTALPPIDKKSPLLAEVSQKERLDVLVSRKNDSIIKASAKSDFIMEFILLKKEILREATNYDNMNADAGTPSCLEKGLDLALSPTTKTSYKKGKLRSNLELSKKIVSYYDKFLLLRDYLMSKEMQREYDRKKANGSLRTRSASSKETAIEIAEEEKYGGVLSAMDRYFSIMDEVDRRVRNSRETTLNDDKEVKGPVLRNAQKAKKWEESLVPKIENDRYCPFCGHESINNLPENEGIVKYNAQVVKKYNDDNKVYDAYLKDLKDGKSPPVPSGMNAKRRPRMMMLRKPGRHCKCSVSFCLMENLNVGLSCLLRWSIRCLRIQTYYLS